MKKIIMTCAILSVVIFSTGWSNPRPEVEVSTINIYPPQIGLDCMAYTDLSGMEFVTSHGMATVDSGIFAPPYGTLILDSSNTSGFAFSQEGDFVQIPAYWQDYSWGNSGRGTDAIMGHILWIAPYYASYLSFGFYPTLDFTTLHQGFTQIIINEINAHGDWGSGSNYIELYNKGNSEISLAGWKIICDAIYELPYNAIIRSHKFYIIDGETFPPDFHMDSSHDNIYLVNAVNQIVDQVGWSSDHGLDMSFMRYPDGNADSSYDMHDFWGYDDATSTSFSDGFPSRRAFNRYENPGLKIIGIDADTSGGLVNLYWTNPIWLTTYDATTVRKSITEFPPTQYDGDLIYEGTDQEFIGDTAIAGQVTYYSVFARTGCGQYSTPDSESQISVYMPSTGIDDSPALPDKTGYLTSYPNPFNATTLLTYKLAQSGPVEISIFNLIGQKVAALSQGQQNAGEHSLVWNAASCPSGVYFARLEAGGRSDTKKLVLLK